MDNLDLQVIRELRRTDPFYIGYTDKFILKQWGCSFFFQDIRVRIAFHNLKHDIKKWFKDLIN